MMNDESADYSEGAAARGAPIDSYIRVRIDTHLFLHEGTITKLSDAWAFVLRKRVISSLMS